MNSLQNYFNDIAKYQLLNAQQELELGRRIKENNDNEARRNLICSNLRLVVAIAKSYKNRNVSFEDLIADGNVGLMTAVEKYDYTLGHRFSTCATSWIKQAITRAIANKGRLIRLPVHIIQQLNDYNKAVEKLQTESNSEPTLEQIAKEMKVQTEEIQALLQWKQNTLSIETPLGDEEGNTLEDICADTQTESPVQYTERRMNSEWVAKLIDKLDPRTQKIIKLRFGIQTDREYTLEEIGSLCDISRERVRQIINAQLAQWKKQFKEMPL